MAYHTNIPASYLILMQDNQILLLRRANTWYEDGNYSLIAGHVDPGETFTECIMREAEEEAGITLLPEYLRVAHIIHRDSGQAVGNERIDAFFVATKREWTLQNKEPHKCDDLSWFPLDQLPDNIIPYIKHTIQAIQQNISYSEYGRRREAK